MMKLLLVAGFLTFFSVTAFAQLNKADTTGHTTPHNNLLPDTHLGKGILPPQVSTGFLDRNPEIEHATWEQDGENYIANFEKDGKKMRTKYNYDGTWIADFILIDISEVPEVITKKVETEHNNKNVEEVYKLESEDGIRYQLSVSDGTEETSLRFDEEGNEVEIAEDTNTENVNDNDNE